MRSHDRWQSRRLALAILFSVFCLAVPRGSAMPRFSYYIAGAEPGPWPEILSSIGLIKSAGGADAAGASAAAITAPAVVVIPQGTDTRPEIWIEQVERGAILVLEGESAVAEAFGFVASAKPRVSVESVEDLRAPELRITWEHAADVAQFGMPDHARVFARERWQKIPLMAGYRMGEGAVLWLAVSPGTHGYERLPYIPQALADLGLEAPLRSNRLWAFFDSAYRSRADLNYLAARWRASGISALQIAAWHFWEHDAAGDEYLERLIDACHRNGILAYAWLELPHVSEKFWNDHPQWREKTALLQDAELDWRKLINLANPEAAAAVSEGMSDLIRRFDWDGVNLAELYFESLEGHQNPTRFTPMNDDVRREFRTAQGFDPLDLFTRGSVRHWPGNTDGLMRFFEYRAELARRLQQQWIGQLESLRRSKPHLDLVLTHIDDRFDTSVREKLGADTSRALPLLSKHDLTFLIEDPATIWNLGPRRYPEIAAKYAEATHEREKLAVDINVVERYQDVYPTKRQTGVELFELVHTAAAAFPRVALYFENSIGKVDQPFLSAAAAKVDRVEQVNGKITVHAGQGAGVPWKGRAYVDGEDWPVGDGEIVWIPAGTHIIEAPGVDQELEQEGRLRLTAFNGELRSARFVEGAVEFAYLSSSRALAALSGRPARLEVDGFEVTPSISGNVLFLPKGQHVVRLFEKTGDSGSSANTRVRGRHPALR